MEDGVDDDVIVSILFSSIGVELFVDDVEGSGIDFGGDGGVFFGPILKNLFEVRTLFVSLLQLLIGIFVEVILDGEGRDHQI